MAILEGNRFRRSSAASATQKPKTPEDARLSTLEESMSHILILTNSTGSSVDILPALELLNHRVHI
ncbi:hypothetical protein LXJ57_25675, partial [Escherichia coli]|nr:hypothetical protein [Escherichia coli]